MASNGKRGAAVGQTAGQRKAGSAAAKAEAEAADQWLEVDGPAGGRMTTVDFIKVYPISRPTLNAYREQGIDGFAQDQKGGVYPLVLVRAIEDMKAQAAKPIDDAEVKRAKDRHAIDTSRKSRIALQMVLSMTVHVDDMRALVGEYLNAINASVRGWPRTLSIDLMSWLSTYLIKRARADPALADDQVRAVQTVMKLLDQGDLGREIGDLLDAKLAQTGKIQADLVPRMISIAKERGYRASGMKADQ